MSLQRLREASENNHKDNLDFTMDSKGLYSNQDTIKDKTFNVSFRIEKGFCNLVVNGETLKVFKETDCFRGTDRIAYYLESLSEQYQIFLKVRDEYNNQLRFARWYELRLAGGLLCLSRALKSVLQVETEVIGAGRYVTALLNNEQAKRDSNWSQMANYRMTLDIGLGNPG